ncbi:MAG: AtpZ/AtpI family protein [Bacteroidota bacterium]|nr:AtpZ/AtpI family protein [Bacteroidota bacterium]
MKNKSKYNDYIKYSSMGIQMVGIIIGLTFLGKFLDKVFNFSIPFLTIVGILIGLMGAMYFMISTLKK